MGKFLKVVALAAVTALVLAMPVAAQQGGEPQDLQSNTLKATAGVFESEVDWTMDVHRYADIIFQNCMSFIGYGGDTIYNPISLGFATKFRSGRGLRASMLGNIYLSAWYTGNFMRVSDNWEETVTVNYNLQSQLRTGKETTKVYTGANNITSSNNQIEALVGFAGMGLKLGYWENETETRYPDRTIVVTEDEFGTQTHTVGDIVNYFKKEGNMRPSLVWGMNIPIGDDGLVIRPIVSAVVNIAQNELVDNFKIDGTNTTDFTTVEGRHIGTERINYNGTNADYIKPDFLVGAYIDLPLEKDAGSATVDFSYGLGFDVYNNSYKVSGFSGDIKGTVDWVSYTTTENSMAAIKTERSLGLDINEITGLYHKINVGYYMDKEIAERFTVGFYAGAGFEIDNTSNSYYNKTFLTQRTENHSAALSSGNSTTETETDSPVTTVKTTEFRVNPFINLGATYSLFQDERFSINAGISILPFVYTSNVTRTSINTENTVTRNRTYNGNGDLISETVNVGSTVDSTEDSLEVDNRWEYFQAGIWGGFVFYFNSRASLDMCMGGVTDIGSKNFEFNIANVNVLFTVKF
jgi:hypothetical protein